MGGPETDETMLPFDRDGKKVFQFTEFEFEITMPAEEWDQLSDKQKQAFVHVLENYSSSPNLTAIFEYYEAEGVSEIEIRRGDQGWHYDGTRYQFGIDQFGQKVAAAISYDYNRNDPTKKDINDGSKVVITFNTEHVTASHADWFGKNLVHELAHPYVADVQGADGTYDDHTTGGLWTLSTEIWRELVPGESIDNVPTSPIGGVSYLGSAYGDNDVGTTQNDLLAGMGGDDVLNGMGGSDTIAGGAGMDTLIAGSGFSYLHGGTDADTYIATSLDAGFLLEDTGGVDRLRIAGSASDIIVWRVGDNLLIRSDSQGFAYEVIGHYVGGKRVEIFEFSDAEYSASYLEYLADSGGGPGVCYEDGHPVICGNHGMPVVIDLKGNGIRLVEADRSRVVMDVNNDGVSERVGWTRGGDDGFLVLDRNGNGRIDSFSEMSFLSDFRGAGSDLEGLLAYDSDGDGFLTAADDRFGEFQIWLDRNGDGVSQSRELLSLTEAGIVSIGLEIEGLTKLDQDVAFNQVLGRSSVLFEDGSRTSAHDVALHFESDPALNSGSGLWPIDQSSQYLTAFAPEVF